MFEAKKGETLTDARVVEKPALSSSQVTPSGPGGRSGDTEDLPTGDADRYRITDEHSRGGLGRILRAEDESLGREVAVKELIDRSPSHEQRFIREALITARLQHPSIVPVHEAGRWPSGDPYYVMKLIHGDTLKQLIAAAQSWKERLALLPNAIAVADALAYAHSRAIIHRDVKPSNVVVGEFGETVVVDWGLAEDLSENDGGCPGGDIVGTPAYMPPEQARGERVDRRADVYALGALLYHMLAGSAPYAETDDSNKRIHSVLGGPPTPIRELEPHIPADLVAIVEKAMSRDPDERYASAAELAADLKRFQTGKVVTAHEYSTLALVRRWLGRHRAGVAAVVATLSLVTVLGILAINRIVEERNTARTERAQAREAHAASESRQAELLFFQAESSLLRDPTAAVAWLKEYPKTAPRAEQIAGMAEEARSLGVARHVFDIGSWVMALAFVGENTLITGDKSGAIRVWNPAAGTSRTLSEPATLSPTIGVSPRAGTFAYGARGGQIVIVDLDEDTESQLEGHDGGVGLLRFTPDGRQLISSGEDRRVRIWDVESGKVIRELVGRGRGERGNVSRDGATIATVHKNRLEFRRAGDSRWRGLTIENIPDTRYFAVASQKPLAALLGVDGVARVVDLESGELRTLTDPANADAEQVMFEQFDFSPSGRHLVATGADRTVRLWNVESGKHRVFRGHQDSIYMAAFSPDETLVVSAGDDATARLWDVRTGAVTVLRGHSDDVIRAVFSPGGKRVATASLDGTVRIWPTRFDDSNVMIHTGFVAGISFPNADTLISQSLDGRMRRWKLDDPLRGSPSQPEFTSRLVGKAWPGPTYPDWRFKRLAQISPSGSWAAAPRKDGRVDLWSVKEQALRILEPPAGSDPIVAVAFSADEETLSATDGNGRLMHWPVAGGAPEIVVREPIAALGYAPDGALAMITPSELVIRDTAGDEIAHLLRGSRSVGAERDPFSVLISPHGDRVAAFRRIGLITVCGRGSGGCRDLSTGGEMILGLSFSDDAQFLAAACADRNVWLWNVESGEKTILRGHSDLVQDVQFGTDSNIIASASYDKTVRLWNRKTGTVSVLRGHKESVESIAFAPDGDRLASASRDGTVRVWRLKGLRAHDGGDETDSMLRGLTTAVIRGERPVTRRAESKARAP